MITRRASLYLFFLMALFFQSKTSALGSLSTQSSKASTYQTDSIVVYKVGKGDNYFSIARKHGISAQELMQFNHASNSALRLGQLLRIPVKASPKSTQEEKGDDANNTLTRFINMTRNAVLNTPPPLKDTASGLLPGQYVVKKGDYLYSIARNYDITLQELKDVNNLKSNSLKIGQILTIPTKAASTPAIRSTTERLDNDSSFNESDSNNDAIVLRNRSRSVRSVKEVEETGVATWLKAETTSKGKCYALHRSAPLGTVIKVTNTMNNKSVLVKVVGTLQLNSESDNTLIKVSLTAAKAIGVINDKFQARLNYALPKNE